MSQKKCKKEKNKNRSTPSFIVEIPLSVSTGQNKSLDSAFEASRQLYNACLGECIKRVQLIRQSQQWQQARKLPKGSVLRTQLFAQARIQYQFSEYEIHAYTARIKNSWIGEQIGIHIAQKLATRAFGAAEKMLLGKAKRVRFKTKNQIDSIEGKNNQTGLIWKGTALQFKDLSLQARIDEKDPVIAYGLMHRVKYCRLVRRRVGSQTRFFVQLICQGNPLSVEERKALKTAEPLKTELASQAPATIGLDLGPSTIAIVGKDRAELRQFCSELKDQSAQIRRLQRKLDRQRRAINPDNYHPDGRICAGKKTWKTSNQQKKTQQELREVHRRTAAHRKSLHGRLINEVIPPAAEVKFEKLSYRGFQKQFGKSVGIRAPGMFIQKLKQRVENTSGSIVEFSTVKTRLSQTCICERVVKKPLSQRIHECECGVKAQRDLFSAFLAQFVHEDELNVSTAKASWASAEELLRTAYERAIKTQTANGRKSPSSFGKLNPEKSCSSEKERTPCTRRKPEDETSDAVGLAKRRAEESWMDVSLRTTRIYSW